MEKVSNCKKVAAVVVTYNRKELLTECIDALLNQNYDNCEILVIDNASTDGTEKSIEKYKNKIKYYNTGENLGGAGGFNYGMKKAYDSGCDFVWLMDDDCIVHKDSLKQLMNHAKNLNYDFGFLSSKVLWKDNTICKMNIQKNSLFKKNDDWNTNRINIIMATFVSFLVPISVINEVGFPITDFFIWADDLEYSRRISRKYNCYLVNDSVVTHKSKNNIGSNIAIDESENLSRYNYSYRNERYIFKREGLVGRLYYFLKIRYHKFKVLRSNSNNKKEKINIINSASKIGKKFNPPIEYAPYNKKRILYMYGEWINMGGQETYTLNILNSIDNNKMVIDLFTPYVSKNELIEEAVKKENGKIYSYDGKFENEKGSKKDFYKNTKRFLKMYGKKYDIVHINSGSTFCLAIGAKLAKKYGAKNVIVHSHATGFNSFKHRVVKSVFAHYFNKYADYCWSCSKNAAYWKFPKKLVDEKCKIVKNTIDIKKYKFSLEKRNKYRKEYKIGDNSFVIGTIGRMSKEKNHEFLLKVFKKINSIKKDSFLVLLGDGPLMDNIKNIIELEKIENVIILGRKDNVDEIINIFDVFVLPSIYEGFPLTAVESQANSLPCVFSENITLECKINKNVIYIPLDAPIEDWANKIINLYNDNSIKRDIQTNEILEYDRKKYVKEIENEYFKIIEKSN